MKILYICNEFPPILHGGIGTFTKLLAENLVIKGHEILVVGYGDRRNTYKENLNGVKIVRLKKREFNSWVILNYLQMIINKVFFYFKVNSICKKFRPDLVETYDWSAPLIFKPKKIVLVTRIHGSNTVSNSYSGLKKNLLLFWMERKAIKQANYIISVSDHIANATKKVFNMDFAYSTIYNGIETNRFINQNRRRDINKIILVGRMHHYKGFDDLFKAMDHIFENHKNLHFQIICTVIESYKNKLLSYVNPVFHERIEFTGRVANDHMVDYYNLANLSVLPSRVEALGIVPLESMACGTPVIMTGQSPASDIIDNEIDGFIVERTDPKTYAKRILEILSDQDKIESMREKARKKIIEKFSIEKVINDNIKFYQSILS